jgi:hypothetical protein
MQYPSRDGVDSAAWRSGRAAARICYRKRRARRSWRRGRDLRCAPAGLPVGLLRPNADHAGRQAGVGVPQDRTGRFSTELFERYQRSERALVAALAEMYVQGVSTRKSLPSRKRG